MSSTSQQSQTRSAASTVEFKRKLIMQVKQHPSVWKKNYVKKQNAWKMIEKEMGSICTLKELQASWASIRAVYFRKIFIRTIERNFEAPTWIYFHDMAFLYDTVKENIQYKLGGISPPLFKPRPNPDGSKNPRCPCCIYDGPDEETDIYSAAVEQENESSNSTSENSESSFENYQQPFDSEETSSACSINAEDIETRSRIFSSSAASQQNMTENSLIKSISKELVKDKTLEIIDLNNDTETINKPPSSPAPLARLESLMNNFSAVEICSPVQTNQSIVPNNSVIQVNSSFPQSIELTSANECMQDSHSPTEIFNGTNCAIKLPQYPKPSEIFSNGNFIASFQKTDPHSDDNSKTKLDFNKYRYFNLPQSKIRAIERLKIIEAVKANPDSYLQSSTRNKTAYNIAWNKVAELVGSLPISSVKNRWRLIKMRYLKELVHERYSNEKNRDTWECFEKLEFLRPLMQQEINEIHTTRMKMENTIKKKAEESSSVVESVPSSNKPQIADVSKEISTEGYIEKSMSDQSVFYNNSKGIVAYINTKQDIKIACVKTMSADKTYSTKSNQIKEPAKQIDQSVDLTSDDDQKSESNENSEDGPPPKKLRLSTGSEMDETSLQTNKTLTIPPLHPVVPGVVLDLTADEVTIKPATINPASIEPATLKPASIIPAKIVQSTPLQQPKLQKVYPPLDLTHDDDPLAISSPGSDSYNPPNIKFQQVFEDEFVNTNKVFATLDLTSDEDKDEEENEDEDNKEIIHGNGIASMSKNGHEKVEENVICLDDEDSVGSYEEVIVYVAEQNACNSSKIKNV